MERTGPQYGRVTYCPYSDSSSSELQSYVRPFDTVRALHETVVSLRTALEESRREVDQLRQQINVRETVEQGRNSAGFRGTELSDSRSKPVHSTFGVENPSTSGLLRQPANLNVSRETCEDVSTAATEDKKSKKLKKRKVKTQPLPPPPDESCSSLVTVEEEAKVIEDPVRPKKATAKDGSSTAHQKVSVVPDIQIVSHPGGGTHSAMASRIDVKIKVSSNINMDGSSSEAESSECPKESPTTPEPAADQTPEEDEKTIAEPEERGADDEVTVREQVLKAEGVENLRVSVVNEEHLSVSKSSEAISIKQVSSENLHVDTDRQSNASISEGDNSVFAEDPTSATQPEAEPHGTGPITGSYTLSDPSGDPRRRMKKSESENQEEVDDIELIFSSDDNAKDITQEDLVSISDYEPWHEAGQSGTPVLVSFTNLASDQEKMGSLERSDSEVVEGYELEKGKSLESQDSLSMDNMKKSMDFSTKSSSLEKDSSLDYGASGSTIIPGLSRAASNQDEDGKQGDSFDVGGSNPLAAAGALGRRWTNYNVLIETDISKCGITEENILEMGRRNTCPNPPAYRPIIHPGSRMQPTGGANRSPLAVKFSRSPRTYSPHQYLPPGKTLRTVIAAESGVRGATGDEVKRSRAAQTDISALAQQWRSETHLTGSEYVPGLYTLPSKFVPPPPGGKGKFPLSIPPSFSMTSPGVSQWTVNESSIATQTTQTDALWTNRGDSFDSSKSYSAGSRYSTLSKHHRSRSVPSMRCAICRQTHHNTALRPSESMHYTPRVTFQEQPVHKIRGSLPDLRHDCNCPRRYGGPSLYRIHGDSGGSTDSLLEEAEEFLRRSLEGGNMLAMEDSLGQLDVGVPPPATAGLLPHVTFHGHAGHAHPALHHPTAKHRRCSENDIQRDYIPSKQALPFLPKTPKCLKPGHLAKVISPTGRVIVGRVRYIGPVAGTDSEDTYVGLQLPNNLGDCDGTIDGKRFFECEPLHGIFVPFKKVVMAWNS
ncbi:uncharacterized protein LOC118517596 isoform X2 [Anopheles stephensi]|uniref:uncharacterized protein LOC118517596 isoform X2 n=1 Tax=Anopheles stephensi TaxID=30069 RepID=UPI001658980D|nr:uncharacterized protein LOC118517596 isoform X2 [Anopheles stephensi]